MNVNKTCVVLVLSLACGFVFARGGASSGGGGHASSGGGHSSVSSGGSRGGFSSAPASRPAPAPTAPAAPQPARPVPTATPAQAGTTSTTTTTTRAYSGGNVNYGPGYAPGYYHNDGLLTGLIIGNMMHPHNTVVYSGPGPQGALLYPDGRVVNQQGQQIGTYQNGQYADVQNGAIVAQPAPPPPKAEKSVGDWVGDILTVVLMLVGIFVLIVILWALLK